MPKKIFTEDDGIGEYDYGDIDRDALLRMGDDGFADVYPPPGGDEIFDDQFLRRAREIHRIPNDLKPVHVVPMKNGPWSGNNQLGILQPFEANAQNQQTILKLDEWGFPRIWTVHLAMDFNDAISSTFEVVAKVLAGVGGNTIEFEVDWSRGASFSFAFNALNVVASYSTTTDLPDDLKLGVLIGHNQLPGARPTRTFTNLLFLAGGNQVIKVPKFAKYYRVLPVTLGVQIPYQAGVTFELLGSGSGAIFKSAFDGTNYFTFNPSGKVPIPGGTEKLFINNASANNFQATVEFELALGNG